MTYQKFLTIVFYTAPLTLLFGVLLGAFKRKALRRDSQILWIYLVLCLSVDIAGRVGWYLFNVPNHITIPIFGFCELAIFYWLYRTAMNLNQKWIGVLVIISLLLIGADIVGVVLSNNESFQSYGRVLDTLVVLILCVVFYWHYFSGSEIREGQLLLINNSIFIYVLSALLVFLPVNFLIDVDSNNDLRLFFWLFHFIVTMIFYFILIRILWKSGRSPRPSSSG